ncbi:MAG TPA: MobF family relaxase [Candidatus Binataceae bacterium]|nr:MobF family relaxase [Candidatus Binataceae bacterium]
MMSMSPGALNSGAAERYFEEHYSQDDYYTQGQTCVGQWMGQGAAELGLSGAVSRDDFAALLQGIHPRSGAVLVPAAVHNGQHAAGWDSVFSAPKSVSIQALIGADQRLIKAHEQAVQRTLHEVEKYAIAHFKGNRERVVSANVAGAAFNHLAARPVGQSEHGPDPQLHTHVVLLNLTKRPDGQWRGLDPIEIYRSQTYGSAVYRSELAREVQKLGYRVNVTDGKGAWELEGYSRDQVMAFSQRRQDIQQQMAAAGVSGPKAAQIAALNSRQAKGQYDEAALKAEWQGRAHEQGIDAQAHLRIAQARGNAIGDHNLETPAALAFAVTHTTEREAVIDRRLLEATALQHAMGRVDLDGVRQGVTAGEQRRSLIRAGKPDWQQPQGSFTTDEMLALERQNLALVQAGIGQAQPLSEANLIQQWGQAKGLAAEQIRAAELTLTSTSWASAIEGLAGTAKTTTVGAIREFTEAQGYAVQGFGMTSGSVKALKEAGLEASTVASLLTNQLPSKRAPELWVVDESSLLATRPVNQLLQAAQNHGVERVIFVGDQRQHHAIEAGAPLRQFLAQNLAVAELQVIRRQKDPELKQAVELAAHGRPGEALDKLEEQQRVHEIGDVTKRYQAIAANFLIGHEAGHQTLVVSPGNDERRKLNQTIRTLLVEHGHVHKSGREHAILVARDLTQAQMHYARNYAEGDVVHFSRAHKRQNIARDSYHPVTGVNRAANTIILRTSDGGHIEASPARWRGVQVYTWEQRTLAVGDRLQFRIHDKKNHVANGEFATITALKDQQASLRFDSKRELTLALTELRHVDYGYTSTSHSSQGATVDRVIVNADSMRSAKLVNQKQFYVSISRARHDARVFTDDLQALRRSAGREPHKGIALEAVKPAPLTTALRPERSTTELQPQRRTSIGIRP